jgi:hypothetical protein
MAISKVGSVYKDVGVVVVSITHVAASLLSL